MTSWFQVNGSSRIFLSELNNFFFDEFPKKRRNLHENELIFCVKSGDVSHLTPADFGDSLQNLIVIRINCGMNRPRPFFKGALALMNPSLRNKASVIFQKPKEKNKIFREILCDFDFCLFCQQINVYLSFQTSVIKSAQNFHKNAKLHNLQLRPQL